jgi:uncharacterized membrane protein YqgA involved in biofilm formation
MLALFLFLAFGLLFGYFATLNMSVASVSFGQHAVHQMPMYVIILLSLGIGVVISSIFYLLKSFSDNILMGKKEKELEQEKQHAAELMKRVHRVEDDDSL